MSDPACSADEERLKQLLKILDAFCSDSTAAELKQLANEAKRVVKQMQNFLERSVVEQVVELVKAKQWDKATEQMKINFPGDSLNIGRVEEVLETVFLCDKSDCLISIIKWVGQLDVQLQPRAYEALYEHFTFNKLTNQPEVLLLQKRVGDLPAGVLKNVRAQLDQDFQAIVKKIVEEVKSEEYSLQTNINKLDKSEVEVGLILNEVATAVVGKFESFTLENTLLLIQYSRNLRTINSRCFLMDALLKKFKARRLLDSEQSLQLWAHAKYTVEEQPNWKNVPKATQKLCTDVLDKLKPYKFKFFRFYQNYVEEKDKQIIEKLHQKNWYLRSILSEFVTWYYKKEDLTRVQNLLSTAREINDFYANQRILTQLQIEMHKFQQTNTFECFRLFNMVKLYMAFDNFGTLKPELKTSYEELKGKAPSCLRLLLWPEENEEQLQLVNKFFDSPLCIQQDKIVCSSSSPEKELLFGTSVDRDTALTFFSFKSEAKCCKLDAAALEDTSDAKKPWSGTPWKLKPVDETHVKIFTDDGECQEFC
jgi:hypothetical protein